MFALTAHPIVSQFEDKLCRLRSSSEATTTSSSSITHKLKGLQDLHDCVDDLLLLHLNTQGIAQDSVNGLLDGSLRLLDVCSKDALSQTKEPTQEIQSVLRRRCEARTELKKFISTRKMVKKTIQKAMKSLRGMGNERTSDNEIITLLVEAQSQAVLVLESFLSFINGKKVSSGSFVSKIMGTARVASSEDGENEFAMVDAALQSVVGDKGSAENVQNQLKKLEVCIQDFEDGVESLFRRLIKTRVSLLNIINH